MRSIGPALACLALACAPERSAAPAPAATTTARWGPAPDPDLRVSSDAPLDPRRVRLDKAAFEGTERICLLVFRGSDVRLTALGATAYEPPTSRRLSVRCRGETGTGWADLVFDDASSDLADLVSVGQRLRVRVESGRGHRGQPVLSFVAFQAERRETREETQNPDLAAALAPPPAGERDEGAAALVVEVPVGADWSRLQAPGGHAQACALASVGEPEEVPEDEGYAPEATHRLSVFCQGPAGAFPVDVTFSPDKRLASLRFRRGEVVPLEPVARTSRGVRAHYVGP